LVVVLEVLVQVQEALAVLVLAVLVLAVLAVLVLVQEYALVVLSVHNYQF
jgi:hypothetical protein